MDYTAEISKPTTQINNLLVDPNTTLSNISPYDQQRDQIAGALEQTYAGLTMQMVQTKQQTDSVNEVNRYVKNAEGENSEIQSNIKNATTTLAASKQNLLVQLAKQKIIFELLGIFVLTLLVYIFMGSSEYVHGVALVVLVLGILYVLNYNAYRLKAIGSNLGSPTLSSLASVVTPPSGTPGSWFDTSFSGVGSWFDTSFFSPPNAPTP